MNSEDAGLVQYAKTLDSLDAKLTQLSNNFQTFYMGIFDGDFFKGAIDILNNVITNISRLGTVMGTINVIKIISQIKLIGQLLLNLMSPAITKWKTQIDQSKQNFTQGWDDVGDRIGKSLWETIKKHLERIGAKLKEEITENGKEANNELEKELQSQDSKDVSSNKAASWGKAAYTAGTMIQVAGLTADTSTESGYDQSVGLGFAGGTLTAVGQWFTGNKVGAVVTGITTVVQAISSLAQRSQVLYANAKKSAEEAQIERAQKQSEARGLESTINNLKKLQKAQYDSEEAQQAYIDACNTAAETYPELVSSYTAEGNALIDIIGNTVKAEELLIKTREQAARSATDAASKEYAAYIRRANAERWQQEFDSLTQFAEYGYEGSPDSQYITIQGEQFFEKEDPEGYKAAETFFDVLQRTSSAVNFIEDYAYALREEGSDSDLAKQYRHIFALYGVSAELLGRYNFSAEEMDQGPLMYTYEPIVRIMNKNLIDSMPIADSDRQRLLYLQSMLDAGDAYKQSLTDRTIEQAIFSNNSWTAPSWQTLPGLENLTSNLVTLSDKEFTLDENNNVVISDNGQDILSEAAAALDYQGKQFYDKLGKVDQEELTRVSTEYEKGIITLEEYSNFFKKFGITATTANKTSNSSFENIFADAIFNQATSSQIAAQDRIFRQLGYNLDNNGKEKSFVYNGLTYSSLSEWHKDYEENSINEQAYFKHMYGDNLGEFQEILTELPITYAEMLGNQLADINDILADDKHILGGQQTAMNSRKTLLQGIDYLSIPRELYGEFFSILTTDMGTQDWADKLKRFAEENNIDELTNLKEQIDASVYENITTHIQSLTDKLAEFVKTREKYQDKQEKGWEFTEARAFYNEAQNLGILTHGEVFDDLFSYDETGKLILTNFSDTMSAYYDGIKGALYNLVQQRQNIISGLSGLDSDNDEEYPKITSENIDTVLGDWSITDQALRDEFTAVVKNAEESESNVEDALRTYAQSLQEQQALTEQELEYINKQLDKAKRESQFNEYAKSSNDASSLKSLLSASNISDLENLYTAYGGTATPEDFFKDMSGAVTDAFGNVVITDIRNYADWLIEKIDPTGNYEVDEIEAAIEDALLSIIKTLSDNISAAFKGTLSAEDFQQMAGQVKNSEAFKEAFTLTSTGYKVNKNGFQAAAQGFMELGQGQGLSAYNMANQMADWLTDAYDVEDAYEMIKEAEESVSDELKQILALTRQIIKETADTREFDFMNVDAFDGAADNLDKITSSMSSAISTLQTAMNGDGKLSYKQFESMFQWMKDFGGDAAWEKLGIAANKVDDFAKAVRLTIDYAGNVDLGAALSQYSSSFSNMGDSLGETFKTIAEEQENYWENQANMLDKLAKMEEELKKVDNFTLPTFEEGFDIDDTWAAFEKAFSGDGYENLWRNIVDAWVSNSEGELDNELKVAIMSALSGADFSQIGQILSENGVINADLQTILGITGDTIDPIINQTTATEENTEALENLTSAITGENDTAGEQSQSDIGSSGERKQETNPTTSAESIETAKAMQDAAEEQAVFRTEQENLGGTASNTTETLRQQNEQINFQTHCLQQLTSMANQARESIDHLNGAWEAFRDSGDITKTITFKQQPQSKAPIIGVPGNLESRSRINSALVSGGIAPGGKTLVGELGPELGVYDGMYHLLGQNGAEFVDLPSQALIFNHAQTEALLRGKSGVRINGAAMANGNVSGPAFAGGYAAAAERAREIAQLWQGLAGKDVTDLLAGAGGGGGGGGDNTIKATTEELEEWYNLSRQIANVEQEINNLVAERENIAEGDKYLRSLREQQVLLKEQQQLQKTLLNYQQLQLKRQADLINQNKLWSQFLTVTEEGLLQYVQGNEINGGKGALKVLQELNEMSGVDQVAFLNKIGYSYTTQDGDKLEGAELVQQFFTDLQNEIDKYDELYDTVHETNATLEKLESDVTEINDEVHKNQMDLEKEIFNILVDAWKDQIEQMKEQNELVKQANQDYVDGLNNALTKERELYSQNESVAERESLQRRLSLLRRSGGSETEIASLEDQIDSMLKDEYFNSQEDMIQNIEEANDRQVQLLEQQVQLQQDALDFEKENGVLWTKVYEIMNGSSDEILKFMQGKYVDFFAQSMLQQEEMLTDWAFKIGIYTEDRAYTNYEARARDIFAGSLSADQTKVYSRLAADKQAEVQDLFNSTFASSRLQGMDEDSAIAEALKAIKDLLPSEQNTNTSTSAAGNTNSTEATAGKTRYVYMTGEQETAKDGFEVGALRRVGINTDSSDEQAVRNSIQANARRMGVKLTSSKLYGFSTGGLVDYTGLAMVHGSSAKPEAFLNAEQTAQIREALTEQGRGSVLRNVLSTLQDIRYSVASLVSNTISSISIAPGAIVINVDELNNAYDINDVSNDIMTRITSIASKATNTGVARR